MSNLYDSIKYETKNYIKDNNNIFTTYIYVPDRNPFRVNTTPY